MDNESESDYIVINGGVISAAYVRSLGAPVGAVREFVRRLVASDQQIVEHVQSLGLSVSATWEFLRRLRKHPGLGTQIEASVLDSLLSGLGMASEAGPLPDSHLAVYEVIRDDGPIQGKDICRQAGVQLGNLKNHILPALRKRYTVLNKPGAGYYLADR
jgi:hypothetical protein